jgi:preprotein translocase subunit YajC
MLAALMLLAEQTTEGGGAPSYFSFMWMPLVLLALYFIILRPSQKQEAQRRTLLTGLKKGDKIENKGGIIGVVDSVKDKDTEVVLRGGIRITKDSIIRIIADEPAKDQKEGGA